MSTTGEPKATAQGTLANTPFAHLVQFVMLRELGGTLALWPPEGQEAQGQSRVLFNKGVPVALRTSEPEANLADALVALFAQSEAPYAFYEGQNLLGDAPGVLEGEVDPYTMLSHGVRGHAPAKQVDDVLRKLGHGALRLRVGFPTERLDLEADEAELVDRVRQAPMSIPNLLDTFSGDAVTARRVVYLLTLVKGLEAVDAGASTRPIQTMNRNSAAPAHSTVAKTGKPRLSQPPPPASIPPPDDARVPNAPDDLSTQDRALWDEVVACFSELDHQNHFELLGVGKSSATSDITTAYFTMVKKWHPERIRPALEPLTKQIKILFERITEAHETLTVDDERVAYVRTVADGGGTRASERMMIAIVEAAMDMQKAEVLLRRRNHAEALEWIEKAIAKNPDEAGHYALRGWLNHLLQQGAEAELEPILADIDRTLKDNPRNSAAHYYRGMVLKRMSRSDDAREAFQVAHEVDPRNLEAAREVRLANIRHSKPPKKPGGIWKKLFSSD
jgi:hypothetical protein